MAAPNPANSVHTSLLRHLHLIINKPVALPPQPGPDQILDQLLQAPSAVQHTNTVTWKFIAEAPRDGTNLLVWQAPQMKDSFPSDGYVWLDPESLHHQDIRGHKLQIFTHRAGFRPGREQFATHARRRFRLMQNPSFELVVYRPADPRDQTSAASFPVPNQIRSLMQERDLIHRTHALLVRKEFMLYDTQGYPTVMPPNVNAPPPGQQNMEYPGNVMAHMNRNQQAALKQRSQHQMMQQQQREAMEAEAAYGGGPAKRLRRASHARDQMSATAIPGPLRAVRKRRPDMEEDAEPIGDFMDAITPREIALERYMQHHEWLEEVLSSPYPTKNIIPPSLGLGRKGELESLTRDFFDAPTEQDFGQMLKAPDLVETFEQGPQIKPVVKDEEIPHVENLSRNKVKKFRHKAARREQQNSEEMERMRKEHGERMADLKAGPQLRSAEQSLRAVTLALMKGESPSDQSSVDEALEAAVKSLESFRGRTVKAIPAVECLEEGGREEIIQTAKSEDQDEEMMGVTDLDGMQTSEPVEPSPQPNVETEPTGDIDMIVEPSVELDQPPAPAPATSSVDPPAAASTADGVADDFVMVSKDDAAPSLADGAANTTAAEDFASLQQGDAQAGGGSNFADFDASADLNFEPNDFGEGIDFGDMDTAGDALSGYAQEIANMGGGKRDDLGPDSPTVQSHSPGTGALAAQEQPPADNA